MRPAAAVLLLALPAAAEFPIGVYNVTTPRAAREAADAGFTHLLPAGDREAVADAARKAGMSIVGIPSAGGPPRPSTAPPVAAWYIADEPEVNHQSPETIARLAGSVRRWDPGTRLTLVVGDGRAAGAYAASVDVLMVDWYPVPHLPLSSAGDHVSFAVAGSQGKPVWAVLQAMDWRDYPQRDPNKPRIGRFPTREELRFMSYHALVRGASGIFYFEFQRRSVPGSDLPAYPERWQALTAVVRELAALRPILEAAPGEGIAAPGLEGGEWRLGRRRIRVLVNPRPSEADMPAEYLQPRWKALFEPSPRPEQAFGARLGPWRVAVLAAEDAAP